jgi:hypothetical protein
MATPAALAFRQPLCSTSDYRTHALRGNRRGALNVTMLQGFAPVLIASLALRLKNVA